MALPWKSKLLLNIVVQQCCMVNRYLCTSENEVRVRFAPSPTGFLHLGGLRTALYNYLFAKANNGKFILRIEDTDRTRLVDEAVEKVENDLEWAGLIPDESPRRGGSYGPYLQSERLSLYQKEVQKLLENGTAYYCFCSDRRLDLMKKDAIRRREVPKYDNRCRNLSEQEVQEKLRNSSSHCIRFKLTPFQEPVEDLVYGSIVHDVAAVEGDPIIIKSDGYPTYHFANVVDDHFMKISHVLRGVEWQSSTPKHLLLYKAFNWTPPKYAHLPLLMNDDGTKLSKRNSNMTVEAYRNDGMYPSTILNVIVSAGGGFKTEAHAKLKLREVDELISKFQLKAVNPHNCQLKYELLDELNRLTIRKMITNEETLNQLVTELRNLVINQFAGKQINESSLDNDKLKQLLVWSSQRICRLSELVGSNYSYIWILPSEDALSNLEEKYFELLNPLVSHFKNATDFNEIPFTKYFKQFAKEHQVEYGPLLRFLRACLSGLTHGPSVGEMMIQLGQSNVVDRLQRAENYFNSNRHQQADNVTLKK
ncbi:nondiscriminating glutamyl-tRNA synthetase EARS2, mitochondrial [Planococcus citri]|uniref:nondiscriminating glutamyl-tRNA synthetase EARS2, mitochondrial n=1 Tax=Planococcus citri TaxID=170843 RepID=UPI0031F94DB6